MSLFDESAPGLKARLVAVYGVLAALNIGAYEWAFVRPIRKLHYNMTITLASVVVALLVGGIEALGLAGDKLGLSGGFWEAVGFLDDNLNDLGFAIIGVFLAAWLLSYLIYRVRRLDELEVRAAEARS